MKDKRLQFLKFTLLFYLFTFLIFSVGAANAATLYFSPSSGNFTVGDILTTSVLVNTQSKAINNTDAVINFPAGLLEVVSVNKSNSIFSLWVEEPSFSNSAGTISFNGGLPTPGFNGTAGKIINAVFRVQNTGLATLLFSSGAVRANDGLGTDILQTKAQAQFNLISEERPVAPSIALGTPQAPRISSPTHPDSNKWYAKNSANIIWPTSADVTATRLLVGKISTAEPVVLYIPPIREKTVENLGDGVWYFHVQLKNDSGWGEATHFRFRIDTENPDHFDIKLAPRDDMTDPRVRFIFKASDKTSGIDHYEVQIDDQSSEIWHDDGTGIYQTSILKSGNHRLIAKAVDRAGNFLLNSIEFTVESLKSPVITDYPRQLQSGDPLVVRGSTYSDSKVTVWFQRERGDFMSFVVRSDQAGIFTFVTNERLLDGVYRIWAEVEDNRGARSEPSEKVVVIVQKPAYLRIGDFVVNLLSIVITIVALITLLLFISWYMWRKFSLLKKHLRKEVRDVELVLHKAFDLLKEDVRKQIKLVERTRTKRELTEEEEKIVEQLKKDLDSAEKFVEKEIQDIEKEVK